MGKSQASAQPREEIFDDVITKPYTDTIPHPRNGNCAQTTVTSLAPFAQAMYEFLGAG
jgi:hypothetical protein